MAKVSMLAMERKEASEEWILENFERLARERKELFDALVLVTDTYWGVDDDRQGDGGKPPSMIVQAREIINKCRASDNV